MRVLAISNQKGGVGKSTTAINLGAGLARGLANGKGALVVDLDPQAAITTVFLGLHAAQGPQREPMMYEVLMGEAAMADVIQTVDLKSIAGVPAGKLDIAPAHLNLSAAEMELIPVFERERRLREALEPLAGKYEYVIIDCPPSLGLLTINALMAANEVIITIEPGFFALVGLELLSRTIEMLRKSNTSLHVSGVLLIKKDQTVVARDTEALLQEQFGKLLLPSIPHRVAVKESQAEGLDIFAYAPGSAAAEAYRQVVREVIVRGQETR